MLHAVVSNRAQARLDAAERFIDGFGAATEIVVIAATREAADDCCRRVALNRGATFGLHRFTLGQFAGHVARAALAARGVTPASRLGAEAIAARATFEVGRRPALGYLEPVVGCPGFPRALASTLADLRQAGVPAGALARLPQTGPDLARLLEEYGGQLARSAVVDRAELLIEAARLVRERTAGSLAGLPILLLDVRVGSRVEGELIEALGETSPDVLLTVAAGDEQTRSWLPRGARVEEASSEPPASGLARLRAHVFAAAPSPGGASDDVLFFSAPGEGRECVEVARRVLREAARGVPFDEMAVVVRAAETYWAPLEHALTRAGIPAWYSRGTRRPDPSGRAFLALLACAADDLSARRFAEYLSLGQVPRRDEHGAPAPEPTPPVAPREETLNPGQLSLLELLERPEPTPRDVDDRLADAGPEPEGTLEPPRVRTPWKWESLLVEAAVIGQADRWRRRLDGLAEELSLRIREADSEEPGSARAAALARDRDALDDLRRFTLPLIDDLAALPRQATWGEWLSRLEALAPRALRHPARVLELLAELRPMAAVGPLSLAEVRQVLLPRLAMLERDPPRVRYGRVFVCTPDQLRGRAFRVVFVLGLAERVFPQRARQDPLLLDALRRELGSGLETEDQRVVAERLLLRLAAGAAADRLYLSYPRLDVAQARPRVPSFYALDVVRALTGEVPNHEKLERETAVATGAWLAWPAPADADQAIDDWEHDLAVLGPMLRPAAASQPVKGEAHYLLTLNPVLARSLRARWSRWKKRWTSYDGLLGDADGDAALLASQRLTVRPYSATSLQRFAACPYQFLLGAIYRLEPMERPESIVQLDPLTRGALFHEVQRDTLRALDQAKLLPVAPPDRARARALLDAACDAVVERYSETLAPAIDRVWQDETEALRADLRMWLAHLAEGSAEWIPRRFELSFGLPIDQAHDPASVAAPVLVDGRFLVRGAIDLVEERAGSGELRITDHKTGKNRTTPQLVVGGGAVLQPVLYALAAEQLLGRPAVESRLFFATTTGGFESHVVSLRRDEARRAGVEVLEIVDRAVERGCLPPAPREGACGFCDFKAVCGPLEEQRFKRKVRDLPVVGDLLELRRMR